MTLLIGIFIILFMLTVSYLSSFKSNWPLGIFCLLVCSFIIYNTGGDGLFFICFCSFYVIPFFKPIYDIGYNRYPIAPIDPSAYQERSEDND